MIRENGYHNMDAPFFTLRLANDRFGQLMYLYYFCCFRMLFICIIIRKIMGICV